MIGDREQIARALAKRFIERGNARITGSPFSCWEEMPRSYTDDFYVDADAILALDRPALSQGERYRHVKRGTVYEVVGTASLQNANNAALLDHMRMVIYRGDDGKLWAREEGEFHDGRFLSITPASGGE